jgi:CBS domain-containing protein
MATVRDLIKIKGNAVWTISPATSVLDTLKFMADKDVGALLVVDEDQILGVISERDFVRSIAQTEQCLLQAMAQNYMTKDVVTVSPDQTIDDCMQLMTKHRIRHLPVVEGHTLVGLISIGDVVKEMISSKESMINNLENFIEGRGFGA